MKNHLEIFKVLIMVMIGGFIILLTPRSAYANAGEAPYYGFGTTNGRTDTVNINDYHTNSWDRFEFNYQFHSGGEYRYELGNPTTYNGQVQIDVYTANVRRDKNTAFVPPGYGVFSGIIETQPTNYLFPQSTNPAYWTAFPQDDPHLIPMYDTLQIGVNAQIQGNAMNMYNMGDTGTLPNTSVGGEDVIPIGANNATGNWFEQDGEWFFESGSDSSTVTVPVQGGFLPPTSI